MIQPLKIVFYAFMFLPLTAVLWSPYPFLHHLQYFEYVLYVIFVFLLVYMLPRIKAFTSFVESFPLGTLPRFHLSKWSLGRIIFPSCYILLLLYAFILVDFRFGEYARFYMRDNQVILSSLIRVAGLLAAIVLSKSRIGFSFIILYVLGDLALGRRFTSVLLLIYLVSVYLLPRTKEFFRIFASLRLSKSFLVVNFVIIFSFVGLIYYTLMRSTSSNIAFAQATLEPIMRFNAIPNGIYRDDNDSIEKMRKIHQPFDFVSKSFFPSFLIPDKPRDFNLELTRIDLPFSNVAGPHFGAFARYVFGKNASFQIIISHLFFAFIQACTFSVSIFRYRRINRFSPNLSMIYYMFVFPFSVFGPNHYLSLSFMPFQFVFLDLLFCIVI